MGVLVSHLWIKISIHAPARGATQVLSHSIHLIGFQSTLPRGERPTPVSSTATAWTFQSTLPRGERLKTSILFTGAPSISIHAPARGATFKMFIRPHTEPISIHAPARGATSSNSTSSAFTIVFQSTLPRGERPYHPWQDVLPPSPISIHAPARGATLPIDIFNKNFTFQSTLPRGERRKAPAHGPRFLRFQSTLPRGERRRPPCGGRTSRKFQSTLPRGERQLAFYGSDQWRRFQSTLPRGERLQAAALLWG